MCAILLTVEPQQGVKIETVNLYICAPVCFSPPRLTCIGLENQDGSATQPHKRLVLRRPPEAPPATATLM